MLEHEIAVENFKKGMNCSQAVATAFCDKLNIEFETMYKMSEGFGGGMGRKRHVCGAVSAMVLLSGLLQGSDTQNNQLIRRKEVYSLVQNMLDDFEKEFSSVICATLLGDNLPKDKSNIPTERTSEFYKKRPCSECVEYAAKIVEKYIKELGL